MPIYEYGACEKARNCKHCAGGFEVLQRIKDPPMEKCPQCGAPVERLFSAPVVGGSRSGLDDRAREAGFHKLQRLGKGEYEKKY